MENKWTDVTSQLFELTKSLSFMETILHPDVDLEETMHAHEINDPKIDPKWDIKSDYTISKMIQNNQVRNPETLSLKDMKNIFVEVFKLQTLVLQTQPLQQTIYTFSYLYDENLWKKSVVLTALVESINTFGTYLYQLHKNACSYKEDDLNISTFSFRKVVKSGDEVGQLLLKAQRQIQAQIKAQKEVQAEGKELISFIKLRRSMHLLIKGLGNIYDSKHQGKIESEIKTLRKRMNELQTIRQKSNSQQQLPEKVFNTFLLKTIRSNFGCKDIKPLTLNEAFGEINNMIEQLELFLPAPLRISDYRHRLDILSFKKINLLAKSYLKSNFFIKEGALMGTVKTEQALANDIKQWIHISPDIRQHQKFLNLINLSASSMCDSLFKQLGRNTRWFWQISKIYEDINVLIHVCTEIDNMVQDKKKDSFIASWFYNYATTSMIRQVLWGFQEDLYQLSEYHYVTYYLEYILHINVKNNVYFTNKLDKNIVESVYNKTLTKKQKKHLSQGQKRFLADSIFLKGLHYYFRSFYRLLIILIARGHISDPFKSVQELRINNRFRIFKNVMFLKKLDHETYEKEIQLILSDQGKILDEATQLLKAGKSIFGDFNQFQDHETFYKQCEQAVIMEKLCVKLSLVVMTLKFKQPKKFSIKKEYSKYPSIQIQ